MKLSEIAQKLEFKLLTEGTDRDVKGLYACDLLSWVMGRAKEDQLWFTVMGNVNAIAVASLADVSGIVLVEGASLDDEAKMRAEQREISVYSTELDCATAIIKTNELL